jgi:hypothetical protein
MESSRGNQFPVRPGIVRKINARSSTADHPVFIHVFHAAPVPAGCSQWPGLHKRVELNPERILITGCIMRKVASNYYRFACMVWIDSYGIGTSGFPALIQP